MGVPKFHRWLSERYPCLSQIIKKDQIPEFDNFYLDMNGIIHPCSHKEDYDPFFQITEEEMFENIFKYMETLVQIIKPQKTIFMAVDGCAPRAKMNQQRGRRFKTVMEVQNSIRETSLSGETLPDGEAFDSNCITPGTEFMARLHTALQYFINHKISTDPLWKKCSVHLSGHNVPGEGEHKVMDYIRYHKSQPGYNPNTRHCLYGLDADLIMLGLSTHEPYFCLIREDVRFDKHKNGFMQPDEQTFQLFHFSLLREYIELEFKCLQHEIPFYDIESIIDDWIFLIFMVGNDFIPHLPHMFIDYNAISYLHDVYRMFLKTTDGYLNDGGNLNLSRLQKFFKLLSTFDLKSFGEVSAGVKYLESKNAGDLLFTQPQKAVNSVKKLVDIMENLGYSFNCPMKSNNPYGSMQFEAFVIPTLSEKLLQGFTDICENGVEKEKSKKNMKSEELEQISFMEKDKLEVEYEKYQKHYYEEYLQMDRNDKNEIQNICYEYVRALQWISHYYFNGLPSWSCYYPYHYAPSISDIAKLKVNELHFDMGKPFQPFEQLLAVLPPASKKVLPKAYQSLMITDDSPIKDYYPNEIHLDRRTFGEPVVPISFIDETRLLNATHLKYLELTGEEKQRNTFGDCLKYSYDKTLDKTYISPCPQYSDIKNSKAKLEVLDKDYFLVEQSQLKKGLLEGTKQDIYYPRFPTMKHLDHIHYLKRAGVKVFRYGSCNENAILKIVSCNNTSIKELAEQLIGETAFVLWPYMVEAYVTSIYDNEVKYYFDSKHKQLASRSLQGAEYKALKRKMNEVSPSYMEMKGIELDEVNIMVEARLLQKYKYKRDQNGKTILQKAWEQRPIQFPYQAVVKNSVYSPKKDFVRTKNVFGHQSKLHNFHTKRKQVPVWFRMSSTYTHLAVSRNIRTKLLHFIPFGIHNTLSYFNQNCSKNVFDFVLNTRTYHFKKTMFFLAK